MICVLVVDPQPDVRLAFAYMLDSLECKVAEAASAEEALRHLETNRVDVVLTTLYLPGNEGVALTEGIHRLPGRRPKILAMSGSEGLRIGPALQSAAASIVGADALLRKPATRERLLNAIHALTGSEP